MGSNYNKSQGQSLNNIEIDINNIFTAGQLYVSLSRIKNVETLSISNISKDYFELLFTHHSHCFDKAKFKNQIVIDFYNNIKNQKKLDI